MEINNVLKYPETYEARKDVHIIRWQHSESMACPHEGFFTGSSICCIKDTPPDVAGTCILETRMQAR